MDLDDLDFLSDYLKNRDKIVLSDIDNDDDDDTNMEPPKKPASRKRTTDVEIKAEDDESNVSAFKLKFTFMNIFFNQLKFDFFFF